ncbi:MAG: hypothetical protein QOD63_65 [Actinomycetota bacterium]|jgi:hypothetical protein|nr:hypothetical protein [Actinomycetota bacterium]
MSVPAWIDQMRAQLRNAGDPRLHPPLRPPAPPATAHDLGDHQFCDHDETSEEPTP